MTTSLDEAGNHARVERREKLVLGFCIGIPLVLLVAFLVFWFGFRDTWEIDHYSQISDQCGAVLLAIDNSDDETAAKEYEELIRIVGSREIRIESLSEQIDHVREAFAPVRERLKLARIVREKEKLEEMRKLTEQREAERIANKAREDADAKRRVQKGYQGFTESELERLYKAQRRRGLSSEEAILTVKAMLDYPDTRAVARQWLERH